MGIHNVISGALAPSVRAVIDAPGVRSTVYSGVGTFGDVFDHALLASVDRTGAVPKLVAETPTTARALDPSATGWYRRAGDVLRGIVEYSDRTGRPLEGIGIGTTSSQFRAARATSAMQDRAAGGTLDAQSAANEIRWARWEPSLYATHERGRIFLTERVGNVLLNPRPERVPGRVAQRAIHTIDHELGHVGNVRTQRPLPPGNEAEAMVELRTQVGASRTQQLRRELGFVDEPRTSRGFYREPVAWLRGVFARMGATSDTAIAARLATETDDRVMYTKLVARLLDKHGIDASWNDEGMRVLSAPNYPMAADTRLHQLDEALSNTPRGVTLQQWQEAQAAQRRT